MMRHHYLKTMLAGFNNHVLCVVKSFFHTPVVVRVAV